MTCTFRRVWLFCVLAFAAAVVPSAVLRAQSVEATLIATMRSMAAALAGVERYAKADGEQAPAVDNARKLAMLARTIPGLFPAGTELQTLPAKFDAATTSWDDWDRFLDAQKRVVVETSKLVVVTGGDDKAAILQQTATIKQACAACHSKFRD